MIHLNAKPTAPYGEISSANSTTGTLSGGATWTGTSVDTTGYTQAAVEIVISPTNATGTLVFQKSTDNTNWIDIDREITNLPLTVPLTFKLISQYFRVKYENGSVAQTTFRLQTRLTNAAPPAPSVNDGNSFSKIADATLVQNISDHDLDIARGKFTYLSTVHKFGATVSLPSSSTYTPITAIQTYQTPQVAGAKALRIKAGGNSNDTSAGSGAREVTVTGLSATGALQSVAIATNGSSASSATTETFTRIFTAQVSASGSYATTSAGSHSDDITIEASDGSADWAKIDKDNYAYSRTQFAAYTVPLGYEAYIPNYFITVESSKPCDIILLKRENILQTSAPYSAMQLVLAHKGIEAPVPRDKKIPYGPFPALTDLIWMGRGATSPDVTVDFEIVLIET